MTASIPNPQSMLVRAIRQGQAVAIVGSGLSLPAGAPSWADLLREVAEYCAGSYPRETNIDAIRRAIDAGEYLGAAESLKGILRQEFHDIIVRRFRPLTTPTECQKAIVRLPFRAIVTTNYDVLLEKAAAGANVEIPAYSNSQQHFRSVVAQNRPFLLKLHGDVNNPADLVLASSDYVQLQRKPIMEELRDFLNSEKIIFWVGYGHRDLTVESLRTRLLSRQEGTGFAVWAGKPDPVLSGHFNALGMSVTWLDDYQELEDYLKRLESLVASEGDPAMPVLGVRPPAPRGPEQIHVHYDCEDRSDVRELVRFCRAGGVKVSWDQDVEPWHEDYRKRVAAKIEEADAVVLYKQPLSSLPDSATREALRRAAEGGKVMRLDPAHGAEAGPLLVKQLGLKVGGPAPTPPPHDVTALLERAFNANHRILTDTITDRIFNTDQAAEYTELAFRAAKLPGPGVKARFRAELEYARLLRFRGFWGYALDQLVQLMNRESFTTLDPVLQNLIRLERGALEFERADIQDGMSLVNSALDYFERAGGLGPNLVKALRQLGNMKVEQGEWAKANELFTDSVSLSRVLKSNRGARSTTDPAQMLLWIDCLRELASFQLRLEQVEDSVALFTRALKEAEALGPHGHHLAGVLCYHLGRAHYVYKGEFRNGEEYLERSFDILERYDNPVRLAFVYEHIARLRIGLLPRTAVSDVTEYLNRALRIRERCRHTYMLAKTRIALGDLHFRNQEFGSASDEYEKARDILDAYEKKPELARALLRLGRTNACLGDRSKARVYLVEAERILRELKLSNALREVEFELIRLDAPDLFLLSFEEMLNRGQQKEYEFRVNEVGEYAVHSFIRKLVQNLGGSRSYQPEPDIDIEVGIGDDAAVLGVPGSHQFDVVLTTDAAPGSISRSSDVSSGRYAAKFAVVHCVSDILAMGATPVALLLNLYMVRDAKLEYAMRVVETVTREAAKYGMHLIGGDIKERNEQSVGCVAVGLVERGKAILRSGARAGDVVAITRAAMPDGSGPRRIGMRWAQEFLLSVKLNENPDFRQFTREDLKDKLLFLPYKEMLAAASTGRVTSAIDTSDGVLACLQLLGKESGVSFLIKEKCVEEIIDPDVRTIANKLDLPPAQFMFNIGHDWEVVLTVGGEDFDAVREQVQAQGGDLTPLGVVIENDEFLRKGVAYEMRNGAKVFIPFFTDEKFVRRPYQDRVYEWEELKFFIKGGKPLPPHLQAI